MLIFVPSESRLTSLIFCDSNSDWDIWWLGTVPCRKVLLVGLIVGVIEYEKRVLYTCTSSFV